MIILGLDPGLARCGFGLIDTAQADPYRQSGCLTTPPRLSEESRLAELGDSLRELIQAAKPALAAVEELFFGANSKTALSIAQARGVLLYILKKESLPLVSFTPLQIKSRLTGFGRAEKHQIQNLVQIRLKLDRPPRPDDAADALAIALCAWDNSLDTNPLNHHNHSKGYATT